MSKVLTDSEPSRGFPAPGRPLRDQPPVALAGRLLRRITHPLIELGSVTFFARDTGGAAPARPVPGFSVRQMLPADQEALLHGSESCWEAIASRFRNGDLCFGALDEQGRAVHTRWVTLTGARIPELRMDFVPAQDAAYFYDGYTRPDARRRGIDAAVRAVIFKALLALGRRRAYSYVRDDNPGGLRAAGRWQQKVGTIRYSRLLGSRPILFRGDLEPLTALLRPPPASGAEAATRRAAEWRRWFEGWLQVPLERRSIGFHDLPDDAFKAMADHIVATLRLDPASDLVLDLGCDSAMVTRRVAPHCSGLVGVDFIPGMLVDVRRRPGEEAASPGGLRFAAADGRALPFPSATFTKAYCSGVIHTLPSHADGLAMLLELVRVTNPGGQVLVAAVPDVRKRWQARRDAFTQGGLSEKARIVGAAAVPPALKRLARRAFPWLPRAPLHYLEYDLRAVKRLLEDRGLGCTIADYPRDFWSRDFRRTRSNLLITVPGAG